MPVGGVFGFDTVGVRFCEYLEYSWGICSMAFQLKYKQINPLASYKNSIVKLFVLSDCSFGDAYRIGKFIKKNVQAVRPGRHPPGLFYHYHEICTSGSKVNVQISLG